MPTSLLRAGPLAADFVSGANRPTFGVRNGHRIAKFPDGVVTETFFTLNMPTVFANGDIEVKIHWMAESATTGDVIWSVAFERHQPGVDDLDTDSFAADIVASAETTAAAAGQTVETVIAVTAAQYDGITQGDQFRLRLRRNGTAGGDTMTDTAQLMTVVIEQLADPAGGGGGGFWDDGAGTRAGIGKGSPAPTAAGLESLAHGTNASADGDNSLALLNGAATGPSGDRSIVLGYGAKAFGPDSIAIGRAAGDPTGVLANRISIGYGANAIGVAGIAIGLNAYIEGLSDNCISIGNGASVTNDNAIAIGRSCTNAGDNAISIGRNNDIVDGDFSIALGYSVDIGATGTAPRSIGIGKNIIIDGEYQSTAIGYKLNTGRYSVVMGSYYNASSIGKYNICITNKKDYDAGITTDGGTGGYLYDNIAIQAGSILSGINNYNGNKSIRNILLGTGFTHIYGDTYESIVMGYRAKMGQRNNQSNTQYGNVAIGYSVTMFDYLGAGSKTSKGSVGIGYSIDVGTSATYCVAIGSGGGIFPTTSSHPTRGQVAIGNRCKTGPGHGNVILGYSCESYHATYTNYQWHRGNVAMGYKAKINKTGTGGFRSAMAQGVQCYPAVSAHRVFSDDATTGTGTQANPNQGGFVIPKIETTDATQTTLLSFPTIADKAYAIWGYAVARRTDVDGENGAFSLSNSLVYRNAAGAPVLVGDPKSWILDANQGAPPWTMDVSISGNNILFRVTGEALKTIEWLAWIQIVEVRGQ